MKHYCEYLSTAGIHCTPRMKNSTSSLDIAHFRHFRFMYKVKSRLAIRVLNYCKPRINAKRLNDVTATEARGFITCTLSGC